MRILFVEDDPMNRRVVKDMLDVVGLEMEEAPEAITGLKMISDNPYDLVLMDLRMPEMDGLTAIREVRARDDEKSELPIIVVTADTSLTIREDCLSAGADDMLQKPVAMDLLIDAIGRLIASKGSAGVLN